MTLFQLVGLDKNVALFNVPDGIDTQEVFNKVFEAVDVNQDEILDDAVERLEKVYGIKRVYVEEVFTEKL